MPDEMLTNYCPVWKIPCMKDSCVSFEAHTKQRFYNKKTERYVPYDQLNVYANMTDDEKTETLERRVRIVHECRKLGKIIEIIEEVDSKVPDE